MTENPQVQGHNPIGQSFKRYIPNPRPVDLTGDVKICAFGFWRSVATIALMT
jgi:hypothetical protein